MRWRAEVAFRAKVVEILPVCTTIVSDAPRCGIRLHRPGNAKAIPRLGMALVSASDLPRAPGLQMGEGLVPEPVQATRGNVRRDLEVPFVAFRIAFRLYARR